MILPRLFRSLRHTTAAVLLGPLTGCALLVALPVRPALGQDVRRELVGVVRDPDGATLQGVEVEVLQVVTRTNRLGAFTTSTPAVDTVTIRIRHVGFVPIEAMLFARSGQWDTVVVQMERQPQALAKVEVDAARYRRAGTVGFDERRARGNGVFVTREEIVARNSNLLSEVLRLKRGVQIYRGDKVRFASGAGTRGGLCQPDIWLDGARMRGAEVNEIPANTVEGIELYSNLSTIPAQFAPQLGAGSRCGTIVIWSRTPGAQDR